MRANVVGLAVAGALLEGAAEAANCSTAKNFIYVVPDGYGISSQVMARDYYSIINGEGTTAAPNSAQIGADSIIMGTVRTQASDNLVTDSAASGTAFACGVKTYNGAIGVDDDGQPVGSILEAAHLRGLKTGMVVTSRITHATPGSYSSHVLYRDSEEEIAAQQIGQSHPFGPYIDILMGGGRDNYLAAERDDGLDLVAFAEDAGYTYAADRSDLDDATGANEGRLPLPFLGLFESSHMTYEMDRDPEAEPSLLDMTKIALDTLDEATGLSPRGYFLMVEASRIDHAGHANDAAAHVHETLMFNEVLAYLKEFVGDHPDTQLLSAADHECGGLTLVDGFDPAVLARAQSSGEYLAGVIDDYEGDDFAAYLVDDLFSQFGLADYTDDDVALFVDAYETGGASTVATAINVAVAAQAGVNWSTGGHTAADVQLHGFAAGAARYAEMKRAIGTNVNNIELPRYVEKALGVSLSQATTALRKNGTGWVERRGSLESIKKRANLAARAHDHEHSH